MLISGLLASINEKKILDVDANEGEFSFLAAKNNFEVIAIDNDGESINNLYKKIRESGSSNITPLCIDITNPTPATGFANKERSSFIDRVKPHATLALALIHHLVITKNIPLDMLAGFFSKLAPQLIIEFVPKEDEKTKMLLQNKRDIYPEYTKEHFEDIFEKHFSIASWNAIGNSGRYIYLMNRK